MQQPERAATVSVGDLLKIERRLLVDGVMQTLTVKGRFKGVELVGQTEHIVLQDPRRKAVRLYPLSGVSEITVVKPATRATTAPQPEPADESPRWDPGFA